MSQLPRGKGIGQALEQLDAMCPTGFAIALHIKYASSRYLFQAYPREWLEYYSVNGLVMRDPTVRWGFENVGSIRWSALTSPDMSVMERASEYGLDFGFTCALDEAGERSVASFARSDREFTDIEIEEIGTILAFVHHETLTLESLSPEDHAALKRLSILLTRG